MKDPLAPAIIALVIVLGAVIVIGKLFFHYINCPFR